LIDLTGGLRKLLLMVVILGVPIGLFRLAIWSAENQSKQPQAAPSMTPAWRQLGTATATWGRPLDPTGTPAPDFQATRWAAEAAEATHQSGVATQWARVTSTEQAREIEREDELHQIGVAAAWVGYDQAVEAADYQQRMHQVAISNTVTLGRVEAENLDTRMQGLNWILWGVLGGCGSLGLILSAYLGWKIARNIAWRIEDGYEAEVEESTEKRKQRIQATMAQVLNEERAKALGVKTSRLSNFVYDCIRVNGEEDHQVPANTKDGMEAWHANRWSDVVRELKHDGAVQTIRGGNAAGTYVKEPYVNLGGLRDALENGTYKHSPSSRAEAARERWLERIGSGENARE